MSYPGNDSLSQELRQRIVHTFRQALSLTAEGNFREAGLGCDFILHLDPLFEPARTLQERVRAEESQVDDLLAAIDAWGDEPADEASAIATETPTPPAPTGGAPAAVSTAVESDGAAAIGDGDGDILTGDAPSGDAQSGDVPSGDAPSGDAQSGDAQSGNAQSGDALSGDALSGAALSGADLELPDLDTDLQPQAALETPAAEDAPAERQMPADAPGEVSRAADDAATGGTENTTTPDTPEATPPATEPPAEPDSDSAPPTTMTEPSAALDSESEQRVSELLAEGQAAFDRVEYQAAIDAWSRIFLIDIDHPEANRRIELARKLKAEVERTIEELFHEGISQVERGDLEGARSSFEEILELQPSHLQAREYLDRIEGGATPAPASRPAEAPEAGGDEPAAGARAAEAPPTAAAPPPAPPRAPASEPASSRPLDHDRRSFAAAERKAPRRTIFLALGAAVLVAVVGVGWYLWSNWDRTFPNAADPAAADAQAAPDPIARAQDLHAAGRTSIAVAQLRRLPPDDPAYAEAQALIEEWERAEGGEAEPSQTVVAEDRMAERRRLLDQARAASADGENLLAVELLAEAAAIAPLEEAAAALESQARADLEPIEAQIEIYRQGEWELALRNLWLLREQFPTDPDIQRLMVDSYYNLGVRDLQRGDLEAAGEHFAEAVELAAGDGELERLARFAAVYRERPEDLLFRIFVKYLPFR